MLSNIWKNMRENKRITFNSFRLVVFSTLLILFTGCDKGDAYILSPQQWNNIEFIVEIRPGTPQKGMNEFVVVGTEVKGPPAYNYIISIKMNGSEGWAQMIQDGHSGVYRRAIGVSDPVNDVLIVQVKHKTDQNLRTELQFPLAKHI